MKRSTAMKAVLDFAQQSGRADLLEAVAALVPKARKEVGAPSDRGMKFAEWFGRELLPNGSGRLVRETELWARTYDDLVRLDKLTPAEIVAICRWARAHVIWSQHFNSPVKLRRKNADKVPYHRVFSDGMKATGAYGAGAAKPDFTKGF